MTTRPIPMPDPTTLHAWLNDSPPGLREFLQVVAPPGFTTRSVTGAEIAGMRIATPALAGALAAFPAVKGGGA